MKCGLGRAEPDPGLQGEGRRLVSAGRSRPLTHIPSGRSPLPGAASAAVGRLRSALCCRHWSACHECRSTATGATATATAAATTISTCHPTSAPTATAAAHHRFLPCLPQQLSPGATNGQQIAACVFCLRATVGASL